MRKKIHNPRGVVVMFRVLLAAFMASSFIVSSSPVKAAAGLPDLVITNVTVTNMSDTPITQISAEQQFKVNVTVDNLVGDEYEDCTGPDETAGVNCEVDKVYVDVYLGPAPLTDGCDPATSVYNNTNNVDPTDTDIILADDPAKTISILVTVPNSQAGDLELYAYVDVNCSVDEGDETNNGFTPPQPIRVIAVTSTLKFKSIDVHDGWILESTETSGIGGTKDNVASVLYIGDDASDRQYRSVLSFNTNALNDTAVITSIILKVRRNGVLGGGNPIIIFNGLMVDVRRGTFGPASLAVGDFNALASKTMGPFTPALTNGWYSINLTPAKSKINLSGVTQIRLRFKLEDNDNATTNVLKLFSGNSVTKPQLIIKYYIP